MSHRQMCPANNEKRETTSDGRNRTIKSKKNKNIQREGYYKYFGILEVDPIK